MSKKPSPPYNDEFISLLGQLEQLMSQKLLSLYKEKANLKVKELTYDNFIKENFDQIKSWQSTSFFGFLGWGKGEVCRLPRTTSIPIGQSLMPAHFLLVKVEGFLEYGSVYHSPK